MMAILVFAAYAVLASLLGVWKKNARLTESAERALMACTALSTIACFSLVALLLRSDFRFEYVASYSNRDLPFFYKVASLWAGNDGSLLFWSWLLMLFSGIVVATNRTKNRELMPYVVATLGGIALFFTYVNFWVCNPFEQLGVMTAQGPQPWAPADGRGLNPLLQHPIMAIHPPILYVGYVGFVIPFAFCIAALATGRLGAEWITSTRRWTLVAWAFLGTGLLLGGRWAYVELGWGGYWAWDPVENAALLPWLTSTAYLHSVMIQERKGMLKVWNVSLVIITYLLCIFGTFLTRSGVVSSVHAFAESDFAKIFLVFIALAAGASAALVFHRLPALKSENELDSMISRESGFLYNNLLFVVSCFAVLWGTMYPVLSEAIQGEKAMVGPAWFNRVNIPIGLALLALTGVGPLLAWRKSSLDSLRRNFTWPLVSGVLTGVILAALGMRHAYPALRRLRRALRHRAHLHRSRGLGLRYREEGGSGGGPVGRNPGLSGEVPRARGRPYPELQLALGEARSHEERKARRHLRARKASVPREPAAHLGSAASRDVPGGPVHGLRRRHRRRQDHGPDLREAPGALGLARRDRGFSRHRRNPGSREAGAQAGAKGRGGEGKPSRGVQEKI
jgi:cytochrome c-type biogenesis protein CcmF